MVARRPSVKNARRLIPFLALFNLACGLVVPVPTPTPLPSTATQTPLPTATATITPDIAATQTIALALTELSYTATPTATVPPEISPEDLIESQRPLPPPAISPGASYELTQEIAISSFGIRFWHNADQPMGFTDIVMIERNGIDSIMIKQASALHPLTGSDLNGDKIPDAVIETYSGGAHCCFGTQVYSLDTEPKLLLKKPESNTGGQFKDLNDDGILEFITYDDIFAYQYCAFAGSPTAKAVLQYDPLTALYIPASPLFSSEYAQDIRKYTETAEKAKPGDYGEWDDTTKCGVLPMTLAYIYSGDLENARSELKRVYPYPDKDAFWDEIMLLIQDSPLYIPKEPQ
jgi:hypothetical protein